MQQVELIFSVNRTDLFIMMPTEMKMKRATRGISKSVVHPVCFVNGFNPFFAGKSSVPNRSATLPLRGNELFNINRLIILLLLKPCRCRLIGTFQD
jgi:hypothetical protein